MCVCVCVRLWCGHIYYDLYGCGQHNLLDFFFLFTMILCCTVTSGNSSACIETVQVCGFGNKLITQCEIPVL